MSAPFFGIFHFPLYTFQTDLLIFVKFDKKM